MDKSKIENAINHITSLQERLCYCENNLQYIKRLQALKYWLHKFDSFLDRNNRLHGEYATVYASSILVADSHSTIEYAIQFLFMNMAIDHLILEIMDMDYTVGEVELTSNPHQKAGIKYIVREDAYEVLLSTYRGNYLLQRILQSLVLKPSQPNFRLHAHIRGWNNRHNR